VCSKTGTVALPGKAMFREIEKYLAAREADFSSRRSTNVCAAVEERPFQGREKRTTEIRGL